MTKLRILGGRGQYNPKGPYMKEAGYGVKMREGLDDAMLVGLKMKEGAVSLGMQIMKKAQKWIPPPRVPKRNSVLSASALILAQ